jgi:hypothetical protein
MSLEMDGKLEDTNEKRATSECALDVTQLCAANNKSYCNIHMQQKLIIKYAVKEKENSGERNRLRSGKVTANT